MTAAWDVLVVVVPALIGAVPATIAALAAWRAATRSHAEVRTNNGRRAGDYIEQAATTAEALVQLLAAHAAQDAERFSIVDSRLSEVQEAIRPDPTEGDIAA